MDYMLQSLESDARRLGTYPTLHKLWFRSGQTPFAVYRRGAKLGCPPSPLSPCVGTVLIFPTFCAQPSPARQRVLCKNEQRLWPARRGACRRCWRTQG